MGGYDYANARLRALKSRLFDARTYDEWLSLSRVDDLIARLAESTYAEEVKAALARFVGVRVVMEACRLHLARTFRQMRTFFDAEGARLVGLLLARWDLLNLKTILRGQQAGTSPEVILEALVPAGDLDESALRTLVRQPDPTATVDLLRLWNVAYARVVRAAWGEFITTHDWATFETILDAKFYEWLLTALAREDTNTKLVRELLMREIDTINVLTALRLRGDLAAFPSAAPSEATLVRYFLRGGEIGMERLMHLARGARGDEVLAWLRASKFAATVAGLDAFDLAAIQRALDRDRARFGLSFFSRNPLTIATAIGFITAKQVEANNVRLIAHGLTLGWERAEMEKELIVMAQ